MDCYPLLLVDTTNQNNQAYILCTFKKGQLFPNEAYAFDGKPLLSYLGQEAMTVSSDIMDGGKQLSFYDVAGNVFHATSGEISCTGRIIDEVVEVRVDLCDPLSDVYKHYIGTYSSVSLFPETITYAERSIMVDLDQNGITDTVSWTFSAADPQIYGDHSNYQIIATINGLDYSITSKEVLPCLETDLSIFIADVDQDRIFELVVYSKGMSRFGVVRIYKLNDNAFQELLCYVIDPEP